MLGLVLSSQSTVVELSYRGRGVSSSTLPPRSGEAGGQNPEDKREEQISSPVITGVSLKVTDLLFRGGVTAEVDKTVFRGRPRGQAGGTGAAGRGGRPRRGGNAGISSSDVMAGFKR